MGTFSFQPGAQFSIEGKMLLIKRKVGDSLWQLEESKTLRIVEYTEEELNKFYVQGELTFDGGGSNSTSDKKMGGAVYLELDGQEWEKAKVMRAYVEAVLDVQTSEEAMSDPIKAVWEKIQIPEKPPYWSTVYRWKKKYLAANKAITALASDERKRGNRIRRYPDKVLELTEKAIDLVYLTREQPSIQKTVEKAMFLVEDENKLRLDSMQLPLPTRRLVKRMIDAIPAFDLCAARKGRAKAIKEFNSVKGHRTTSGPLERAEIDHTPLDILVVDEDGKTMPRVYATVCIDDYTRNILGIHISIEPPSYLTVAKCLKHAFLPKVNLKEEYPQIEHEWEAHGVMRELVVDNAVEFHSVSLEKACLDVGTEVHYSPMGDPGHKGKIERTLGSFNREVAHGIPGTTFSSINEKGDYDPAKHAAIRFRKLQLLARKWVVDVYHQRPHKGLDGVPPAVVWKKSVNPEDIMMPKDLLRLDAILGRSEERQLTHKGIELYGLLYNSHEMASLRRLLGSTLTVEIRVDETDLGTIAVISPDRKTVFHVPALDFEYANGLSAYQHKMCKRYAKLQWGEFDPNAWLKGKRDIGELVEDELARKKNGMRSKVARYRGDDALQKSRDANYKKAKKVSDDESDPVMGSDILSKASHPIEIGSDIKPAQGVEVKKLKAIIRQRDPAAMPKDVVGGLSNE